MILPKRAFKIISVVLGVLILLLGISAALLVYLFPKDRIKAIVISETQSHLKKKISIDDLSYSLNGVVLKKCIIYNDNGDSNDILLSAEECRIAYSIESILRRHFRIRGIEIRNAKINIVFDDNSSNVEEFLNDLRQNEKTAITAQISSIAIHDAKIALKNPPPHLRPLAGEYVVTTTVDIGTRNAIVLNDLKAVLPEGRGKITADLRITRKKSTFEITGRSHLKNCSLRWTYQWKKKGRLPFSVIDGTIEKLKINRDIVQGQFNGTCRLSDSRVLHADGFWKVLIPNKKILISDATLKIKTSSLTLNELLLSFGGDLLSMKVNDIALAFDDLRSVLVNFPKKIAGSVTGHLNYHKKFNGQINLKDVSYNSDMIRNINAQIILSNNQFRLKNIPITINDQAFLCSVASMDGEFKSVSCNLHAKQYIINTDQNLARKPGLGPSLKFSSRFSGNIEIDVLEFKNIQIDKVQMHYTLNANKLVVDRFNGYFKGSELTGRGSITFKQNKTPVDLVIHYNKMKMQNIMQFSEKFKNRIFGSAQGKIHLSFDINRRDILKSMKGSLEFFIDKGKVVNTGIQNGLGTLLSELKYKLKDIEFSRIFGTISIDGETYTINRLECIAPDIKLTITGTVNRQRSGDLRMNLEFSKNFIQDLPDPLTFIRSIGLNKYKKGNWYSIPFQDTGSDIADSKNIKRLK